MSVTVQCVWCLKEAQVTPSRAKTYKFCSYSCRGSWRKTNWLGPKHPNYKSGAREKECKYCGKIYAKRLNEAMVSFQKRKFCSPECIRLGQKRYEGPEHPLYREDSRRKQRRGKHGSWAKAVLSRDLATCRICGAQDTELHAHHIKSFREYPELRWEVSNGITLCHACHWTVHAALNANGVNSGKVPPGKTEDNPEPSFGRKPVEGVTTRGRAYRRWAGKCEECGIFVSKTWSDVAGKAHIFCSKKCSGTFYARINPISQRKRQ